MASNEINRDEIRKAAYEPVSVSAGVCGNMRRNGAAAELIAEADKVYDVAVASYLSICAALNVPPYATWNQD